MGGYKLIACDLDGTLLRDDKSISEENRQAIHALAERGIHFVPSSGRALDEIPEELKASADIRYILSSNGSVLYDKATGKRTSLCIPRSLIGQALDILSEYDVLFTVRYNDATYFDAERWNDEGYAVDPFSKEHWDYMREHSIRQGEFGAFCRGLDEAEMIFVFFRQPGVNAMCKKRLEATGGLQAACTSEYLLEVFSNRAGKGNALRYLAHQLGIDIADTVALGDTDNDRTAIQAAGLGLAMGNAGEKLKALADDVICTNGEHGIAYLLEYYIK